MTSVCISYEQGVFPITKISFRNVAKFNATGASLSHPMSQLPPNSQWFTTTPNAQNPGPLAYSWTTPSISYAAALAAQQPAAPQYKPLSWRTSLCRHFTRNRGWCPLGDECNYIHDLQLADIAMQDARFQSRVVAPGSSGGDGHSKAATKHSHCWAYVQGLCHVKDCPYLHPSAVHLFVRHTPCLAWPNCSKGALCPFKHPEPIIPKVPMLPHSIESTPSLQPPSPVDGTLSRAVQFQGTTYFPVSPQNSVSPPARPTFRPPVPAYDPRRPYDIMPIQSHMFTSPPWQPPASPHASNTSGYSVDSQRPPNTMAFNYQPTIVSPPWRDRAIYSTGPLAGQSAAPTAAQAAAKRESSIPRSSLIYQAIMEDLTKLAPQEEQFPYVPPKSQRVGHARRVSVTLKSKEDTDALGLFSGGGGGGGGSSRESWKTHGNRHTHKSWAPSSSTLNFI